MISANHTHSDLTDEVDEYELPAIYGGICDCRATCVYSEKGPWSEVENLINYRDPQADSDEEANERLAGFIKGPPKKGKNIITFGGMEEFKMVEDEDDNIDLLKEKKHAKNLDDFYQQEEGLNDLKNMLRQNIPVSHTKLMPSMS